MTGDVPVPLPRPTANGRRSSSVRSSTRMMRGVSMRTMSVCCVSLSFAAKSLPSNGMSLSPGMPRIDDRSLSRMRPASRFVSPSRSRIVAVIERVAKIGSPLKPVDGDRLETSIFRPSETSSL